MKLNLKCPSVQPSLCRGPFNKLFFYKHVTPPGLISKTDGI
jgi:hypothetical protein